MKQFLLFAIAAAIFTTTSAQTTVTNKTTTSTTTEEYVYVTKGYKAQVIDQGGDIKKGYTEKDFFKGIQFEGTLSSSKYQFIYGFFYREDAPGNYKAVVIKLTKDGMITKVLCLPTVTADASLWKAFWNDVDSLYSDQKNILMKDFIVLYSNYLNSIQEKK